MGKLFLVITLVVRGYLSLIQRSMILGLSRILVYATKVSSEWLPLVVALMCKKKNDLSARPSTIEMRGEPSSRQL